MIDLPPPVNLPAIIERCAPGVGSNTMHALIATESGGNPWAINDNDGTLNRQPQSRDEAIATAKELIAAGHRVDMGLTQVDSKNLGALHLSVEQMFEPCTNIAAGAAILADDYKVAVVTYGPGQRALLGAFSTYNTGRLLAGFCNGYINRILAHNGVRVEFKIPRLVSGAIVTGRRESIRVSPGGLISPFTAPVELVAFQQGGVAGTGGTSPRVRRVSPKNAPLAVAGF